MKKSNCMLIFLLILTICSYSCNDDDNNIQDGDIETETESESDSSATDGDMDNETDSIEKDEAGIEQEIEAETEQEIEIETEIESDTSESAEQEAEQELEIEQESETETEELDIDFNLGDFTMKDYAIKICPFYSACQNTDLMDCFDSLMVNDDSYSLESSLGILNYKERTECLETASTCNDFYTCMNKGVNQDCDYPNTASCNGDIMIWCNDSKKVETFDCSTSGQKCISDYYGAACGDDSYSCSYELEQSCEGSKAFWCPGEYREHPVILNCDLYGYDCANGTCADKGNVSCESDSCDGQYVKDCYRNLTITYDCTRVSPDFICSATRFSDGANQVSCQKAENEWECTEEGMVCEGNIAKVCVGGKLLQIDCSQYAGATCNSGRCEIMSK